jgi:ribosomal protein L28
MGLTHPHKIWNLGKAVSQSLPAASPKQYGFLPFELRFKKTLMPILMHQKRITFGNIQTKHSHSRRAFIPNIIYRPLYSSVLDMQVWCCLSARGICCIDLGNPNANKSPSRD